MKTIYVDDHGNGLYQYAANLTGVSAGFRTDAEMIEFLIGCLDALGHPVIKRLESL